MPTSSPVAGGYLGRKCDCGQHTIAGGACESCREKSGANLQRSAIVNDSVNGHENGVPPIVHEVLHSPGQTLDEQSRAFFEPRFGQDFSHVRVHSDARAAVSAAAVNAMAYTFGNHVVFGSEQYALANSAGRELLAHELAHVVQQGPVVSESQPTSISKPSDSGEANADHLSRSALAGERIAPQGSASSPPVLARKVIPRLVHCTGGSDGSPTDPVTELTTLVDQAVTMAKAIAILLNFDAGLTRSGMRPKDFEFDQNFWDRFGDPPAVTGGFMNRLTGAARPTQDLARSEELNLMSRRYQMIADQLDGGSIHYLCMTTARSFGNCRIADCSRDAWACPNVNAIFLCAGFWGGGRSSSLLLIHETAHMIWENVIHGVPGSGGNFRHAECYASYVADTFGVPAGQPECVIP